MPNASINMPDITDPRAPLGPVCDELPVLAGKAVYFHALRGNNGDMLINMGSHTALQRAGAKLVDRIEDAQAIVLNGGAAVSTEWQIGIDFVEMCNTQHPDKPLWVLPSTYNVTGYDFAKTFSQRRSPAHLYSREMYSLAMIDQQHFPEQVKLGVDHDMAFHLEGTDYLTGLRRQLGKKHILVAERDDVESPTGRTQAAMPGPRGVKRLMPPALKRAVKRHLNQTVRAKKALGRPFTVNSLQRIYEQFPEYQNLPVRCWDASKEDVCSMKQFGRAVAQSATVATTRLHIGILAHMLGKPAFVMFGSSLGHKFKGIYEMSLQAGGDVFVLS